MSHAVVVKRAEKANMVLEGISFANDVERFKIEFKKQFPNDWERIIRVYKKHERQDIKHKGHPMPSPDKYLEQMFKFFYKKFTSKGTQSTEQELSNETE